MHLDIVFSPLLPWWLIVSAGLLSLVLLALGAWRRARGVWWRAGAIAIILAALTDPALIQEARVAQRDVALIVEDQSGSQHLGERSATAAHDADGLAKEMAALPDLDIRRVRVGQDANDAADAELGADKGTRLFEATTRALADVPPQRVAGVVFVTDGQVHDVPQTGHAGFQAPLHVLLTGKPDEGDRRLIVRQVPSFGLVGKTVYITLRVNDEGGDAAARAGYPTTAEVKLTKDGGRPQILPMPIGQDVQMPIRLDHGGPTVIELAAAPGPQELTLDNNRAAFVINGVRDRLHVLLISGEPHQGERTWRDLLKSDPSVDLVHFTILRQPGKQDATPLTELALIPFPIRELFDEKLSQFDLVIFDRYRQTGVLPDNYLENIARYVRNGGALLDAADPQDSQAGDAVDPSTGMSQRGTPPGFPPGMFPPGMLPPGLNVFGLGSSSLYTSPLGSVLPAAPNGRIIEQGFKPLVTPLGQRHPVTAGLSGANTDAAPPSWGRWFRQIDATVKRGDVVMSGVNGAPLLVLDRVGRGRVAEFLSDDTWLWTRGFEGGGPQAELLRRMAYWLMKEPDLEENDLSASVSGRQLLIRRQSLKADTRPVTVTGPDGHVTTLNLSPQGGGRDGASLAISQSGLYRVTDGTRTALAAAGALNPIELAEVRATPDLLKPIVDASGGGSFWAGPGTSLPEVRQVSADQAMAGSDWLGLRANQDYVVTGVSRTDLLPGWATALLGLGLLLLAWRREGR